MKDKYEKIMILVVVLAMGLASAVTNANLVAYWACDDVEGGIARDSVGGNDGILHGGPVWVDGYFGGALKFDGMDDYVSIKHNTIFDLCDAITIAAWIRVDTFDKEWQTILAKGDSTWRMARNGTSDALEFAANRLDTLWVVRGKIGVYDGRWHHAAGVYDGTKAYLYVDGELDNSVEAPISINTDTYDVYIGANAEMPGRQWNGLIDEVAIFDEALSEVEIKQMSNLGSKSLDAGLLRDLCDAVQQAKATLKRQKPKETVSLIEKKIAEYESWKEKHPDDVGVRHKLVYSDLYFLLAKAKETVGASKADIFLTYERAIESNALSVPKQGPVLLWLYENVNTDEYEDIVASLLASDTDYMKEVAAEAEAMVHEEKSKAAIRFLEGNLVAYTHWQEKHPYDDMAVEDALPEIYFQLAKAKEAVGASKNEIADAYSKTFEPSRFEYVPQRVAALTWLVEKGRKDECAKVIESFAQSHDTRVCFKDTVGKVCKHFESEKDLPKFQWFLDTLLTEAEYPYDWVIFVESCLGNKTNRWAKAFYAYLDSKPRLKLSRDCYIAETHVANQKFEKAAELYRDILKRCGPEDDIGEFKFQLCRCLFDGGQYREAVGNLENFIANNKAMHGNLVKEAMLMKGRAHVHLGETDKAIDNFFVLMVEYPETKEAPETNFFVGYCYMLQGKFELAKEAFDCVIKGYPSSIYTSKARLCMTRIKNIIDEE